MDDNISKYDVIIIGSGPAGMSAALNMLRYDKSVLLIDKDHIGGQIANAPRVDNLPSINSISGFEFANNFFKQLTILGVCFKLEEVLQIKHNDNIFEVITNLNKYVSKVVIIATGVKPRKINVDNEENFIGHGLSYCAICDGLFFKNKDVCVIGDGNTALQYSLFLSNYCNKVFLCTLSEKFFGDNILVKSIFEKKNIIIKNFLSVKKIYANEKDNYLSKIEFLNLKNKQLENIVAQGLFVAIGQEPNNNIFKDLIVMKNGFIVVDDKMETKTPGLFAIGDCINKNIRQVVTAVNDGSIAAFYANRYINTN